MVSLPVQMSSAAAPANSLPNGHQPSHFPPPFPSSLLARCSSLRDLQQLHALAIKSQLHHRPPFLARLIASCPPSDSDYARSLFDQIPHPDAVLFNVLSRGYARSHHPLRSVFLFGEMLLSGVAPDAYSFPAVLKACATAKALPEGRQAHAAALKLGLAGNAYVLPTLISMYAECSDLDAARAVFCREGARCVVSYNSIITACVRSSRPGEALALFREMQAKALRPTDVTVLSVLSACALLGALELGKWIHEYAKKNGFCSFVKVNTALIDMYAKCGSLEDAVAVFDEMSFKDTQAWSAMIVAYAIHGHVGQALDLFDGMLKQGIKPDEITFLGVLYACSHSGKVEQGLGYFHSMRSRHGIVPSIKHYGCMVDLLARAGRLTEAYEFIDGMPMRPTVILWRALLSACGCHGDVELGQQVFERILELDDTHGGDYVIISNMCSSHGRWEDANRVRKLMGEKGVVKVPGCSSIEVKNTVHEFFSGDGKHPQSRMAHKMVDEVVEQLKLVGYVPDTSRVFHADMAEEEKAASLKYHSEKLAIAFGLTKTPPGTTLRIVKNLRVCRDCHSMAKLASMVFDREIVLRDLNRFHHFKNGSCSCGDFW
ncbi:pentatricopeptide repeat-containing protein At2g02980, chloroplastic-like [Curcuma longa]|uniref:pentatricopeptide repeat-containing protein At2g02980, chloroplastic-like n=1 Tax=Curcuma longa TaxID=136217 RepID=UPI003D9F78C1